MRTLTPSLALLLACFLGLELTTTAQPPAAGTGGYKQPGVGGYQQPTGSGGYAPYQGGYFSGSQQSPSGHQQSPYGYRFYNPYLPLTPVPTTEVLIYDGYFYPPSIKVAPGATVRWTNKGQKPHRLAELTGAWLSPDLAPGDSWSVTLRKPLNHYYYCRHHRLTMNAMILVK